MSIIFHDLDKNRFLVQGYVSVRNSHRHFLHACKVSVSSTLKWLDQKNGVIKVALEESERNKTSEWTEAFCIVYNSGEVAVCSATKGMGDAMVGEAERTAFDLGLSKVWAKCTHGISRKLFERNGYRRNGDIWEKNIHHSGIYGLRPGAEKFPLMVVLSLSYACNAKCTHCPYTQKPELRKNFKTYCDDEVFHKVADEVGAHGAVLRITGGGEPTLHPKFFKHMRYATSVGCKVCIITNGSRNVENPVGVVDAIEFSVDAGTEEEYAKVRPGLSWPVLHSNIVDARAKRRKMNFKTKLIVSIINQKGVDIKYAKKYWEPLVDKVQIRKFLTWGYNEDNSSDNTPYLPPEKKIPCPWLFERLNIDTEGNVTYCGEDIAFKHKFANIKERSIADIWQGAEFKEIRRKHLQQKDVPMCCDCPDWKYRSWDFNYWKLREDASNNTTA